MNTCQRYICKVDASMSVLIDCTSRVLERVWYCHVNECVVLLFYVCCCCCIAHWRTKRWAPSSFRKMLLNGQRASIVGQSCLQFRKARRQDGCLPCVCRRAREWANKGYTHATSHKHTLANLLIRAQYIPTPYTHHAHSYTQMQLRQMQKKNLENVWSSMRQLPLSLLEGRRYTCVCWCVCMRVRAVCANNPQTYRLQQSCTHTPIRIPQYKLMHHTSYFVSNDLASLLYVIWFICLFMRR